MKTLDVSESNIVVGGATDSVANRASASESLRTAVSTTSPQPNAMSPAVYAQVNRTQMLHRIDANFLTPGLVSEEESRPFPGLNDQGGIN